MSQEPKVTRFGADPTVDQELATKAYVDGSSGGGGLAFISQHYRGTSRTADFFFGPARHDGSTAVANVESSVPMDCKLRNLQVYVRSNARDSDSTWHMNVNTVDVNGVITIPDSVAGIFTDITNSDDVSLGDTFAYHLDVNAGSGATVFNTGGCQITTQ